MTIIGKLLEKWSKIEQGLEFPNRRVIIENNNGNNDDEEEIKLPPDEYKRVIQVLETWLKTNPTLCKQKYLEKGIQSTENYAYAYLFKKVGGIKKYIITNRKLIQ